MKQKRNIKKLYLFIIFISIFTLSLIYKSIRDKNKTMATNTYMTSLTPNLEHKELGKIESIIKYGNNSVIAAHYPIFDNDKLDRNTTSFIQKHIDKFNELIIDNPLADKKYKSELNIDYEVYGSTKNIISIKFTILENTPYYANPKIEIDTFTYDLAKSKELYLVDIMKGKYLETLSNLCTKYFKEQEEFKDYVDKEIFRHGLEPVENNYSNFLLVEDGMVIIFEKYQIFPGELGEQEVKIHYDILEKYIKPQYINRHSVETFAPENTYEGEKKDLEMVRSRKIDPNMPMIALTFDDGPYTRATIPILNTLKEHNSVATFFVLGNRVPKHKDIIQRMVREGNEIGNHSYNHKQLTTISTDELREQISKTQSAIMEVIGSQPKIMRPTYGSYDSRLKAEVEMPMILWSIDTEDWKSRDAEKVSQHVIQNAKDGDIVLMHDLYESTAEAVEAIVPALINKGFQLVTISELYEVRGEVLEVGNIYSRSRGR